MRYVMQQKLLSLADSFTIKDENERDAFFVKGKLFSFGDKLSFQDAAGNELVYIDQRLLTGALLMSCGEGLTCSRW